MFNSNKKVPKIMVFLYGIPASGKLTIAKVLSKKTGFTLVHNHLILDIIFNLFGWESLEGQRLRESIYFDLTKSLIREGKNIIFTHVYQPNFIHSSGLSDKLFVTKIKLIAEKYGYIFYPVQLVCKTEELLKRVINPSRKEFSKINTESEMIKWFSYDNFSIPLEFPFNITIENTNLSPEESSDIIINNFPFPIYFEK